MQDMENGKNKLLVAALENGTVIDHIPSSKVFDVVNLLDLTHVSNPVTIGANLSSHKMASKGIIKISDKYLTADECRRLSVIAPNIVVSIIKDYSVVEKITIELPDVIRGTVKCGNPKCITNHEPMETVFDLVNRGECIIRCRYCNKDVRQKDIRLV